MIRQKRLLVIAHSYANFIKDSVEAVAPYVKEVTVLVRTNPLFEIARLLPSSAVKPFSKASRIDLTGLPDNVRVFETPVRYLPTDSGYYRLLERHYAAAEACIRKNNIDFDIIHAHFLVSAGYVGKRLKEQYAVPFVVTAHGEDVYDIPFKSPAWRAAVVRILDSADIIHTVSMKNADYIHRLTGNQNVRVIPNGFSDKTFFSQATEKCRSLLNIPADRKIILNVGHLYDEVKGHRFLIDAMAIITARDNRCLCFIIGDGRLRKNFQDQIRSLGLEDQIVLAGGKPHDEIPLWMNACDTFVLPSLNEGNPTVMFEALGCGKPFVGTKVGGIPEVITSDRYGLLVEPADPVDLAEKLLRTLSQEWDQDAILAHAEQFTWGNVARGIVSIYTHVLGESEQKIAPTTLPE